MQSRYYNPAIGRFLNADALVATGQGMLGNNMFMYCLNNPVNATDNTGEIPVHVGVAFGIGFLVGAISQLIEGGLGWEVLWSALRDGATGASVAVCPSLAGVFISYEILELLLDCFYDGLSLEETMLILGFQLAGEASLPTTNDVIGDMCLDATIGVAKDLSASAAITGTTRKYGRNTNSAVITQSIFSMIGVGSISGGGCGAESTYFNSEGRLYLCIRIV